MKGNKGITLIALVITIIVLLILAGVSIAMLSGENSILGRSKQASIANAIGDGKEQVALTVNAAVADYYSVKYAGATVTGLTAETVKGETAESPASLVAYVVTKVNALSSTVNGVTIEAEAATSSADGTITVTSTDDTNKKATTTIDKTTGKIGTWNNQY